MQVEIYDVREMDSATLQTEVDEEALELIRDLGLSQQHTESHEVRHRYEHLTADQQYVCTYLFPTVTPVRDYKGVIPVRVLKEIQSALEIFRIGELYVLHSPPATVCDPVLVYSKYAWNAHSGDARLIARWGDALASWGDLMVQAQEVARTKASVILSKLIREAQLELEMIKDGTSPVIVSYDAYQYNSMLSGE